jgi:superfamily II DNA helicase RecQ
MSYAYVPDSQSMEKYHYLQAKAPYSLDSLMPLEITDDMYAMNMAFVERYGIHNLPEDWKNSQGIYILFSHLKPGYRFEAYVGQTLSSFHQRLVRHDKERDFWDTAILARRTTSVGFNSLQLNALEGKLRDILDASPNVHVHNGYPTGDKTLQAGDSNLVDEITLSIMRVMFMRGYRNQHMGAEADRLQEVISASPAVPVASNDYNASTGLGKAVGVSAVVSVEAKFEELKAWRKKRATADGYGRQPYIISDDKTLKKIAMAAPKTYEDLLAVSGIGPSKVEKYGYDILEIMNSVV